MTGKPWFYPQRWRWMLASTLAPRIVLLLTLTSFGTAQADTPTPSVPTPPGQYPGQPPLVGEGV